MDVLLLGARLLLAGVFALAAVAKLLDRAGTRTALSGFGVPQRLVGPSSILLPIVELAVAAALLPAATARWGSVGAVSLLGVFIVAIAASLLRGRRPDCHCFGNVQAGPVSWSTVGRNVALLGVAAFALWGSRSYPGASVGALVSGFTASQLIGMTFAGFTALLLAALGWLLLLLWRQQGRLLHRIQALEEGRVAAGAAAAEDQGLPMGTIAPEFTLPDTRGEPHTLGSLRSGGKTVLLLFTDPTCSPCTALLPEAARWQRQYADRLAIVLVSRGSVEANRARADQHGFAALLIQRDFEIATAYGVERTPSAVFIGADGTIGSPVAPGIEAITAVVARSMYVEPSPALNGGAHPRKEPVRVGQRVPSITLPDLHGKPTSLRRFRGRDTVVLFWNPGCVFCQRMLPDLRAWEAHSPSDSPRLVLVSSGSQQANAEMGLRAPILLDDAFAVARLFGVDGTPSAVLVDSAGRVASSPAVGPAAVLAMTRPAPRRQSG